MSEAAVFTQTPAVQLSTGGDGGAVGAAAGDVADALGLQGLNQSGLITVPISRTRHRYCLIIRNGQLLYVSIIKCSVQSCKTHSGK